MAGGVDNAKRALRAEVRERRRRCSDSALVTAAAGIHAQLDRLVDEIGAQTLTCFLSTKTEPGTRSFVTDAVRRGIQVLLPLTRPDGQLDWAVADERNPIAEGPFGLPEPTGARLSPRAASDADLLLIPAAAVDRTGMRLGWGRGYFDRTIGSLEGRPPVYAVIFDSELVEHVPRDAHDRSVTGVVTPSRIVAFTAPVLR